MRNRKAALSIFTACALLLLVQSCTVSFAPQFDERLNASLGDFNAKVLTFLASTSAGKIDTCESRLPTYAELIGHAEAIALQSRARPMPDSAALEKLYSRLKARGLSVQSLDEAPSASALDNVAASLSKMRETDCKQGLQVIVVAAFKNEIVISLDQAMTYEAFLER